MKSSYQASGPQPRRAPVVLQVCHRLKRLPLTIEHLAAQVDVTPDLFIWNNSERPHRMVTDLVGDAPFPVHVEGTGHNLPGIGLFRLAREATSGRGPVILIDDDVAPGPDALAAWLSEYEPGALGSFWAFRFRSLTDYYDRVRSRPGSFAHYCGTAGAIADASLFDDTLTFSCPERYRAICDLWLSYVASRRGFRLFASGARVTMDKADGHDLFRRLRDRKSEFLRYLVANGWALEVAGRLNSAAVGVGSQW